MSFVHEQTLPEARPMSFTIVDALLSIKRNVASCLTADSIHRVCRAVGHAWRERDLAPATTVHAFLLQVLHGNTACTQTVRLAGLSCTAEAYCQARQRLPLAVCERLLAQTCAAGRSAAEPAWRGHRTFLVDGSTFSMPDTPELQAAFGQPAAQQPGCGFPLAHWLAMFDAQTGLLVKHLAAPWRTHDMSKISQLHSGLRPDDVLVADTGFASYAHVALLSRQKLHGVIRAHQRQLISFRKDRRLTGKRAKGTTALFATGRLLQKFARYDQLVEYDKPKTCPTWLSTEAYAELPNTIRVREIRYHTKLPGGRTQVITLVTTLLNPVEYPAWAIAELYGVRWEVETDLRHVKTTMGMEVLRCKTVEGVLKELQIYALVYNLVRFVMLKAAKEQTQELQRLSFIDALRWLRQIVVRPTPLRVLQNPHRPNRQQPRVRKRRPKSYKLLTKPRPELIQELYRKRDTD
jgi:hypothetical protein